MTEEKLELPKVSIKDIELSAEGLDTAKAAAIHRYRRADDYVVIGATGALSREEAEKRRAEARKENQLGFMVRGRRRFEREGERA